jgi:hypothetical protein
LKLGGDSRECKSRLLGDIQAAEVTIRKRFRFPEEPAANCSARRRVEAD